MHTPPHEKNGVRERVEPPGNFSDWASNRFKRPLALALTRQLPSDIRQLLLDHEEDLEFARQVLSRFTLKFRGHSAFQQFQDLVIQEVLVVLREEQKSESTRKQRNTQILAQDLQQIQRVQAVLQNVQDAQKRQQFLAWYTALTLEQRSSFHQVVASIGDGMLEEMVKGDSRELDLLANIVPANTDKAKRPEPDPLLISQVAQDPELNPKVQAYLKHLGPVKAPQFWQAVQDKLQGDVRQLDFLLNLPHDQVDNYLGLVGFSPLSRWVDSLPSWLRGLFK